MFRYCLLFLILSTISSLALQTTRGFKQCYTSRDCPTGKPCFKGHCLDLRPFGERFTPRTVDHRRTTIRHTIGQSRTTARQTVGHRRTTVHTPIPRV